MKAEDTTQDHVGGAAGQEAERMGRCIGYGAHEQEKQVLV